jgi:hypothetical protein
MTFAFLFAVSICIALAGHIIHLERERKAQVVRSDAKEAELLQRIQAPALAARQHNQDNSPKERAKVLAINDDAAFKEQHD